MSSEKTGRPADPYSRLGEAKKQILLAIEGCEEDVDTSDLREALTLIEEVRIEAQDVSDTDYPHEQMIQ